MSHVTDAHLNPEKKAECGICAKDDQFINNVIIPCGHTGFCMDCLMTVRDTTPLANCPTCREELQNIIKIVVKNEGQQAKEKEENNGGDS